MHCGRKSFFLLVFCLLLVFHAAAQTALPSTLSFGNQAVGNASVSKTVKITNSQTVALNIVSTVASGDFSITGTTCGAALPAKTSCTLSLTFTPTVLGARSGA